MTRWTVTVALAILSLSAGATAHAQSLGIAIVDAGGGARIEKGSSNCPANVWLRPSSVGWVEVFVYDTGTLQGVGGVDIVWAGFTSYPSDGGHIHGGNGAGSLSPNSRQTSTNGMAFFNFTVGPGSQTVYPRFYFIPPYGYGDPFYDTTCNHARIAEEEGDYEWIGTGNFILVGDTSSHPFNHFGKPSFNEKAKELALEYGNAWNLNLAFNDQSLVWGGVFDIGGNYASPHATHNIGENLDVRANPGGPSTIPSNSTIRAWFVQKVEDLFGTSPLLESVGTNNEHYHIRY